MKKEEVQQRVLKYGKPIDLEKFSWDEKTNTFSSTEDGLVLDFINVNGCTFKTGAGCTFRTGQKCNFKTVSDCKFETGSYCTFVTGSMCRFGTESQCDFKTQSDCRFDTGSHCTFDTGWRCIFNAHWDCTFRTGSDCTFKTDSNCTFKTGSNCTFSVRSNCTLDTGTRCAIIRRDIFEIIQPQDNEIIKTCPYYVKGFISKKENEEHFYMETEQGRERYEIIDYILSEVIEEKGNVLKVINHDEEDESYIVTNGELYAHGRTIKEARKALTDKIYANLNFDEKKKEFVSKFKLNKEYPNKKFFDWHHYLTGSCESRRKMFIEKNNISLKDKMTTKEFLELTKDEYNGNYIRQVINEY